MAIGAALTVGAGVPARANGVPERVSVSSSGQQGNLESEQALEPDAMTDDGRYVVFQFLASNLVLNDTNGQGDMFVRDLTAGTTQRVNVATDGSQANGSSYGSALSANGRYIVFASNATNLVAHDTNLAPDVFVRNLSAW